MIRRSDELKGHSGPNPFAEAQGRSFSRSKIETEFYPTSVFLSLLNEQHEILLGTRGSGKTFLLRMLTYSHMRGIDDERLEPFKSAKSFIGFYIPMRLEFLASASLCEDADQRIAYFQFAFNCVAALALLGEISVLLGDLHTDPAERLLKENRLVEIIRPYWFSDAEPSVSSIRDVRRAINILYQTTPPWNGIQSSKVPVLAAPLLTPLTAVLPELTEELGLDADETHWVACIDEAEFLKEPFIRCINSFLRSEKRPLVVKMATLPSKHSTLETLVDGTCVQPDGHDFNYRRVDMAWDSEDFLRFTNHLLRARLSRCGLADVPSLEEFLGSSADDTGLDYYRREFGADAHEENILRDILSCVSEAKKARFERIRGNREHVRRQYLNKLRPVYYVRRMAAEDRRGNRNVGWFAGAKTVRQVADGNPRRYIQIMNHLFARGTETELDEKEQHHLLQGFARRNVDTVQGLPETGLLLRELLQRVGDLLAYRVHGPVMSNAGTRFSISEDLLRDESIRHALNLGIDYTQIVPDEMGKGEITSDALLRLSFVWAVDYWLPMRDGDPSAITPKNVIKQVALFPEKLTKMTSRKLIDELQLSIVADDGDLDGEDYSDNGQDGDEQEQDGQ